jgi:hypothetical protein
LGLGLRLRLDSERLLFRRLLGDRERDISELAGDRLRLSPGDLEVLPDFVNSLGSGDLVRLLLLLPCRLLNAGEGLRGETGVLDRDLDRETDRAARRDREGDGDLDKERDDDLVAERPRPRPESRPPLARPRGT